MYRGTMSSWNKIKFSYLMKIKINDKKIKEEIKINKIEGEKEKIEK